MSQLAKSSIEPVPFYVTSLDRRGGTFGNRLTNLPLSSLSFFTLQAQHRETLSRCRRNHRRRRCYRHRRLVSPLQNRYKFHFPLHPLLFCIDHDQSILLHFVDHPYTTPFLVYLLRPTLSCYCSLRLPCSQARHVRC